MSTGKCQHYDNGYCSVNGYDCTECINYMRLYSIQELRDEVRFHPDTYRRLFASEKIPALKIAGKWFATKEAVQYYCDNNCKDW